MAALTSDQGDGMQETYGPEAGCQLAGWGLAAKPAINVQRESSLRSGRCQIPVRMSPRAPFLRVIPGPSSPFQCLPPVFTRL